MDCRIAKAADALTVLFISNVPDRPISENVLAPLFSLKNPGSRNLPMYSANRLNRT
jgi:hypothetical protein